MDSHACCSYRFVLSCRYLYHKDICFAVGISREPLGMNEIPNFGRNVTRQVCIYEG